MENSSRSIGILSGTESASFEVGMNPLENVSGGRLSRESKLLDLPRKLLKMSKKARKQLSSTNIGRSIVVFDLINFWVDRKWNCLGGGSALHGSSEMEKSLEPLGNLSAARERRRVSA
ncbi:hypothetical protein VTN49DRAFT_2768 [Thermomyces lanuginosus]|uniref:uncharacterized protein n=1 Tax=Thermomyces lanuginosus TaxID=5541 RepID=UPI00374327D4